MSELVENGVSLQNGAHHQQCVTKESRERARKASRELKRELNDTSGGGKVIEWTSYCNSVEWIMKV